MWTAITEVVKKLAVKDLIIIVLSVVCGVIALIILPYDSPVVLKIGKKLFFTLISGATFLICEFLSMLFDIFVNKMICSTEKLSLEKEKSMEAQKSMNDIMSFFDKIPYYEREQIEQLIKNGNIPIEKRNNIHCHSDCSVYDTNLLVTIRSKIGVELIKINPLFFNWLKNLYDNNGTFCHFDSMDI